jgi:phosphoglucomutase
MAKKNKEDLSNSYLFSTIVSSSLPVDIARKNNMKYKLSLTGFKYVGDNAKKIEGKYNYFFGFEESYGCLIKDSVRDKDSLQACIMLCEMAAYYYEQGKDMVDALEDIYKEYGYYKDGITNIVLKGEEGKAKINSTMNYFKENDITLPSFKIINKVNIAESISKNILTGMETQIDLPKSNVVMYNLEGGSWFVLRPSGTEPKLKVYYQIVAKDMDQANKLMDKLQEEVKAIVLPLTK